MNIVDISFSKIQILDPKPNNNNYLFDILYDDSPFIFQSCGIMKTKTKENLLNITNKNDLLNIHKIYNLLIQLIYDNQAKWFENNFTHDELKEMFVDILIPNIDLNCLDMTCNMVRDEPIDENIEIIPLFNLKNVIFNGKKFYLSLYLEDYQVINKVNNENNSEKINNSKENEEVQYENIEEPEKEDENHEEEESELEEQLEEEQENNSTDKDELINEVKIDTDNLEVLDLEINEDDIYIIYKLIQNNIYKNMNENLRNIFNKKNVDISKLDINELIYDSDDSENDSDEDENLNIVKKDDFESNFNKLL